MNRRPVWRQVDDRRWITVAYVNGRWVWTVFITERMPVSGHLSPGRMLGQGQSRFRWLAILTARARA